LVRQRGRNCLARGYGVCDLGAGTLISPRTNFRLASVGKAFTAMAIILLVRDGRLRYEATLSELFTGFPGWGRQVTVRHLLTHTSGVRAYEDLLGTREGTSQAHDAGRQIEDDEVLALLKSQRSTEFAAGSRWAYSNSGYVLLGHIVARIARQPLAEFLYERIFGPLGMADTAVLRPGGNPIRERAYGHVPKPGGFAVSDQSATSATQGDGGALYSNLEDLARWDAALENATLLPAPEMREALAPVRLADGAESRWPIEASEDNLAPGQPVSYGFGWFLDPLLGHARMWHFGTTEGFRTAIMRFPAERLTVVVLCNRTDLDAVELARELSAAYLAPGNRAA
jgi:CubicO group peptidase (beta-lactamase class C family)